MGRGGGGWKSVVRVLVRVHEGMLVVVEPEGVVRIHLFVRSVMGVRGGGEVERVFVHGVLHKKDGRKKASGCWLGNGVAGAVAVFSTYVGETKNFVL